MKYWVIIPAAGVGLRMNAAMPKQYLLINDKPVIVHTLQIFLQHPLIEKVIVCLDPNDGWWNDISDKFDNTLITVNGGNERSASVYNALKYLAPMAADNDWVLVHDAVRPCVQRADIDHLIDKLSGHDVGGILGAPINDTIKHCDDQGQIIKTISRDGLWRALTPQMFRYALLKESLARCQQENVQVTDEAFAIEHCGYQPKMVCASAMNIKITYPEDLVLARFYIEQEQV